MKLPLFLLTLALVSVAGAAPGEIMTRLPSKPDPARSYLFYFHGGIVEGSNGRPVSEAYGPYEFGEILKRFARDGFVVISEIRVRGVDVNSYAEEISGMIHGLLAGGVPASRIAVVGASQGGIIAALVSTKVKEPEINYIIISGLFRDLNTIGDVGLHGRVLAIHDKADTHAFDPERYFKQSPALKESRQIITETGRGHGLVYRPLDEWYLPLREWIRAGGGLPDAEGERALSN